MFTVVAWANVLGMDLGMGAARERRMAQHSVVRE